MLAETALVHHHEVQFNDLDHNYTTPLRFFLVYFALFLLLFNMLVFIGGSQVDARAIPAGLFREM